MGKIKKSKMVGAILCGVGILAMVVTGIVSNYIAIGVYDATLQAALGDSGRNYTKVDYEGVDPTYYSQDYKDKADRDEYQENVALNIAQEGMVVLEKGNMPYSTDSTKISFFSESSYNFIYGGTGSGAASSSLTLKSVFEDAGFPVNEKLWNFYKDRSTTYSRGIGSINYGDYDDYSINECPLSEILQEDGMEDTFKTYDTAVFVLSRTGGEGNDLARGMDDYVDTNKDKSAGHHKDPEGDKRKSYLEPDSIELEIIDYLNKNFKDVIIVVNCNNAVELGWIEDYDNVSTVISVPGTGSTGLQALPSILKGETNPSGHLTDTYVYNSFSSPAMMNMGDFQFTENGNKIPNYEGYENFNGYYYVNYLEGIYVGYRYYETRYYDAITNQGNARYMADHEVSASKEAGSETWDYSLEVKYPFGYGESLSEFSYSEFNIQDMGDSFVATVKVTNDSSIAGKDVVQLYAQTPYGEYEKANKVEKSAIQLVGFAKTNTIQPHESEVVTITFDKYSLASYDTYGEEGYILSQGDYYFTIGKDAHAAVNNVLVYQNYDVISPMELVPSPSETTAGDSSLVLTYNMSSMDATTYSVDPESGNEVSNKFDFADINNYGENVTYLTRSDWKESYPETYGDVSQTPSIHSERVNSSGDTIEGYEYHKELDSDSDIYKLMRSYDSLNPQTETDKRYEWGQNDNELELIDLRGASIDDPRWEQLISKMSLSEAARLVQNGGFKTESIKSVNKPQTSDKDGPAGLNSLSGHFPLSLTYPCALMEAQTWNTSLAEAKGDCIGEDCLALGITGWYGPGNNIHRTPFGGRNFEYYSEDPTLSAEMCSGEVTGAAKKGVFAYVKHFALNNQEIHREKESGICTFANEQSIREIYLKAFEDVVKGDSITEKYYEIKTDANGNMVRDDDGNYIFEEKTTEIKACTAIMSSFNRIGPVWAGGCYPLITGVLREEWGFEGTVITDYYHFWFMDGKQNLMAGGSLCLDPGQEAFSIASDDYVLQEQVFKAVRSILYTTVNSNAVNGYIHGTRELATWKNYYYVVIGVDAFLLIVSGVLGFVMYRCLRTKKNKNIEVVEDNQPEQSN